MAIVYAAVVPHAPLLLPTIAKEHAPALAQTRQALVNVAAEAYASQPDILVVLTPHGPALPGSFVLHVNEIMRGGLQEFGDISTTVEGKGAVGQAHMLKSAAETHHLPLHLQTFTELDYGTVVPLTFCMELLATVRLLVIQTGTLPIDVQLRCGTALHDFFQQSRERYAVLASADLSRKESDGKGPRRPTTEERQVSAAVTSVALNELGGLVTDGPTCGVGPIVLLLSMLQHMNVTGRVESFEAPFSVGLLTASFQFGR